MPLPDVYHKRHKYTKTQSSHSDHSTVHRNHINILRDEGGSSGGLILECRGDLLSGLVVPEICMCTGQARVVSFMTASKDIPSKTMNPGLYENQAVLAVLVLAVDLEVLADADSLLDQMEQVLRDVGCKACVKRGERRKQNDRNVRSRAECSARPRSCRFSPSIFRIRRILLPVTKRTCGIP